MRRIFCIGRDYADHAKEKGATVDRGNPVIFCKPADAVAAGGGEIAYSQAIAKCAEDSQPTRDRNRADGHQCGVTSIR